LAQIHGLGAQVALVLVVLVAVAGVTLAVARRPPAPFFLAGVVWAGLTVVLTALAGVVVALADHPPRDPLHIVYGLLGVAALPGAGLLARGRVGPAQAVVWAIAGIVVVILVLRLFQTGG
jgi:hypothetical protein